MRKIKFRAWGENTKFMYHDCAVGTYFIIVPQQNYQHQDLSSFNIMQFTGLKDKNGKEIYEGDIVKQRFRNYPDYIFEIGTIAWNNGNCRFSWFADGDDGYGLQEKDEEDREVIGNVFENPELLKGETHDQH